MSETLLIKLLNFELNHLAYNMHDIANLPQVNFTLPDTETVYTQEI